VAKRKLKPKEVDMTVDEQVELLNALLLIRKSPPKVKDHKYQDLINTLYLAWIDDQMNLILRPSTAQSGFTPQEADALKVLAQTILQRQQGSAGRPQAPAPMVPRTGANPPSPLNPGIDENKFRAAQAGFLAELAKLDREGKEY
jgi:hypothetical protein